MSKPHPSDPSVPAPASLPAAAPLSLIVYTDYKSPYAFVADAAIRAIALEYPVHLDWRPYTLRIEEFMGTVEARTVHNWRKVRYGYMDARRIANRQGLIMKGPRRIYSGKLSSIGMLFAQDHGFFEAYHASTFERFWRHDLDIDSHEAMGRHIDALGASGADFERFVQGDGAVRLQRLTDEAETLGVFGVPMMIFDEQLYWGGDRLAMVREAIEQTLSAAGEALRRERLQTEPGART
jgi:2-hydroxychromene-2-carboxylate isomerase